MERKRSFGARRFGTWASRKEARGLPRSTDYLHRDSQILRAWHGDKKRLHCGVDARETLGFLVG
jgi:hypothetical protein